MTDELASYCATVPEPDDDTIEALRRHLLDWLGLVAGGREHARSSASVLEAVNALAGHPGAGSTAEPITANASTIPTGSDLPGDRAALLGGTFAHSLDFDDTHRESSLHPGAPVIAAALPAARATDASGADLLSAISIGYDVTCAVGRAVDPDAHYARGFHLTATCGTFGATAAVGHLHGFDADDFESAFGVNGSQAAGSLQFLANGAWNKRLHPGLAASRAVTAGALVASGFRGAAAPITGEFGFLHGYTDDPHPERLRDVTPGAAVRETALKPYPCCRYLHAPLDGLLALRQEVGLDPATVERVTVDMPSPGVRLTGEPIERKRRPGNFVDCQFSAPFAAALAIGRGDAGLAAFLDAQDRLSSDELRELMDRVSVVSTDRTNAPFPELWPGHVVVETADGTTHERTVDHARGEPENPLSWDDVETKFRELVGGTPLETRADAVVESVAELGGGGSADALFEAIEAR